MKQNGKNTKCATKFSMHLLFSITNKNFLDLSFTKYIQFDLHETINI